MRVHTIVIVTAALLIGALARDVLSSHAHADAPAAFDRALAERLVRAEEQQARALDEIRRSTERSR